jgi:hypothetical protein
MKVGAHGVFRDGLTLVLLLVSGHPINIFNGRRSKISCFCALLIAFVLGGLVLAIVRIVNAEAAQGLTELPPPSPAPAFGDVHVPTPSAVIPMDRGFLESAMRALENGRD